MNSSQPTTNRTLKSVSDFEQWLNEINLFAQEAQVELHEIAGILNVALAGTSPRPLVSRSPSEHSQHPSPNVMQQPEGDDPLASLQHKLAQQLKVSRSASTPSTTAPTTTAPTGTRPANIPQYSSFHPEQTDLQT